MTVGSVPVVVAREPLTGDLTLVRFITADFGTTEVVMSSKIIGTSAEFEVLKAMMASARELRTAVAEAMQ